MGKTNNPSINETKIGVLRRIVEKTFAHPLSTPKDFNLLSERIYTVTSTTISPTTLKRLWGYISGPKEQRRYTLDLLSRYCGWQDFAHFSHQHLPENESGNIGSVVLSTDKDFVVGDKLKLMWNPGRVCVIQYQGGDRWIVLESMLSKLSVGNTFSCTIFVEGEPLYINNLNKECDEKLRAYVCGRKSGITFVRL